MALTTLFCGACGGAMTPSAKFCPSCGAGQEEFRAFGADEPPIAPAPAAVPPVSTPAPPVSPEPEPDALEDAATLAFGGSTAPRPPEGGPPRPLLEALFPGRTLGQIAFPPTAGAVVAIFTSWIAFSALLGVVHLTRLAGPMIGGSLGAEISTSVSTNPLTGLGGVATGQEVALGSVNGGIHLPLTILIVVPLAGLVLAGWLAARWLPARSVRESAAIGAGVAVPYAILLPLSIEAFGPDHIGVDYGTALLYSFLWGVPAGALGGYFRQGGLAAIVDVRRHLARLSVQSKAAAIAVGAGVTLGFAFVALAALLMVLGTAGLIAGAVSLHEWAAVAGLTALAVALLCARPLLRLINPEAQNLAAGLALLVMGAGVIVTCSVPELRNGVLALVLLAPTLLINLLFVLQGIPFGLEGDYHVSFLSGSHQVGSVGALSDPVAAGVALLLGLPLYAALVAGGRLIAEKSGARTREQAIVAGGALSIPWALMLVALREAASIKFDGGLSSVSAAVSIGPTLGATILLGSLFGAGLGALGGARACIDEGTEGARLRLPRAFRVCALPVRNLLLLLAVARGRMNVPARGRSSGGVPTAPVHSRGRLRGLKRQTALVAAAAILAGAGIAAGILLSGDSSSGSSGLSEVKTPSSGSPSTAVPSSDTVPQETTSPTDTSTGESSQTDSVPTETGRTTEQNAGAPAPDGAAAQQAVEGYWAAIQSHDFPSAFGYYDARAAADYGPEQQWITSHKQDHIQNVAYSFSVDTTSSDRATVDVDELKTYDASFGCRDWTPGSYDLVYRDGAWQIDRVHLNKHPQPCD
jgi:hypothetical protein